MSDASQFLGRVSFVEFTASNTTTVPPWAKFMEEWGCAAGGGGAGGSTATNTYSTGGSSGEAFQGRRRAVTPGDTITVTLGSAGTAGAVSTNGGDAGNTTVSNGTWTDTLRGGFGGVFGITTSSVSVNECDAPGYSSNVGTRYGAVGITPAGIVVPGYACGRPGFTAQGYATWEPSCSSAYAHGVKGTDSSTSRGGGFGGASPYGPGGNGGNGNSSGTATAGATPASGYGGGGGAGGYGTTAGNTGAAGKPAYMCLIFFG